MGRKAVMQLGFVQDGWGITHSGGRDTDLIISDGSSRLTVVDHETLEKVSSVEVRLGKAVFNGPHRYPIS